MQTPTPFQEPPLWTFVKQNWSTVVFLALAFVSMLLVYATFAPPDEAQAQAVSIPGVGVSFSAPISKPVPGRVVQQRFRQSPPPIRIAIIVGHRGSDSGAVCDDGLTELEINTGIVEKALLKLETAGVFATAFEEFDPQLDGYEGVALISVHADSCGYYGETATGFKVAGSSRTDSDTLVSCLEANYMATTGLQIHANTITSHMTDYHAFRKIAPGTPAAIVETGFMFLDRDLLTTQSDLPATGIANGILCYLELLNGS